MTRANSILLITYNVLMALTPMMPRLKQVDGSEEQRNTLTFRLESEQTPMQQAGNDELQQQQQRYLRCTQQSTMNIATALITRVLNGFPAPFDVFHNGMRSRVHRRSLIQVEQSRFLLQRNCIRS